MAHEFKFSSGKIRYDLVDPEAINGLAKALTHGSHKYKDYSWREVPVEEYVGAYQRHMFKHLMYMKTKDIKQAFDVESGLLHIDHAMACLMFIRWFAKQEVPLARREAQNDKDRETQND